MMDEEELYLKYQCEMRNLEELQEDYQRKKRNVEEDQQAAQAERLADGHHVEALMNCWGRSRDSAVVLSHIEDFAEDHERELKSQEHNLEQELDYWESQLDREYRRDNPRRSRIKLCRNMSNEINKKIFP